MKVSNNKRFAKMENPDKPSFNEEDALSAPPTVTELEPAAAQPSSPRHKPAIRFNLYVMLFGLLLVIAGVVITASYLASRHNAAPASISSQNLSKSAFEQLANSSATIGTTDQVLNIQSSAIFGGKVLVRQDLEVAGNLQLGGTLAPKDLAVGGTAQFGDAQINKTLSVAGTASIQGALTAKSLQVSGSGAFSGPVSAPQITTSSLQLSGDLIITHHITTGGPTPGRSNGGALGSGGTSSVSGSDSGGSISINTGGSPAAGCFVTINFTSHYANTPHVLVTPVGSSAAGLSYYINRTASNFSICTTTAAAGGASFGFDYFVVD